MRNSFGLNSIEDTNSIFEFPYVSKKVIQPIFLAKLSEPLLKILIKKSGLLIYNQVYTLEILAYAIKLKNIKRALRIIYQKLGKNKYY